MNSDIAIQVNKGPLSPPYVVQAVGGPNLDADFVETQSGLTFIALAEQFGFVVERDTVSSLLLPAAPAVAAAAALRGAAVRDRTGRPGGGEPVIAVLGLVVGIVLGLILRPDVPLALEPYLPIAVVAALDAVFGGLRAYLDGIFDDKVFVISFVSNVVIAAGIVFLGDQLGVGGQLSTGVIVVLGIRIFANVAAIRRHLFHA